MQGQAVLLRRLSGHGAAPAADVEHRVRADGGDAGRRLHRRSPRRSATAAGRCTLRAPFVEQPDQSGALQPGGAEPRQAAADDDRSVRADQLRRGDRQRRMASRSARIDYQLSANHSFFGRYMATHIIAAARLRRRLGQRPEDRLRRASTTWSHSLTLGDTTVFSSDDRQLRCASRSTRRRSTTTRRRSSRRATSASNIYSYLPGLHDDDRHRRVRALPGHQRPRRSFVNDTYQAADDLTLVARQPPVRRSAATCSTGRATTRRPRAPNGNWIFDGSATGLGLADFLVGRVTSVEHGGLGKLPVDNWYVGLYGAGLVARCRAA